MKTESLNTKNLKTDYNCTEYLAFYKILAVGESSVGKTSFIQAFTGKPVKKTNTATIGADCESIYKDKYKFQLWDTAGQEQYFGLVKSVFRGSDIVLLMFSLSSDERNTLEEIDKWYNHVHSIIPGATYVLVGTKSDLQVKENVITDAERQQEKVCSLGQNKARELGLEYFEISSHKGLGLEELSKKIISIADSKTTHRKLVGSLKLQIKKETKEPTCLCS
jgi:small GTP-binding protein